MELNAAYWESRYREQSTPWDLGGPTPALVHYLKSVPREKSILIPGAGYAYEAEWLHNNGFQNIHVVDYSKQAILEAQERIASANTIQWSSEDFFEHEGVYDLIVEQTFFCAIDPKLRSKYVQKMKSLLRPSGRLVGLLFNFPLSKEGPPFGGSEAEYRNLFSAEFEILHLENCYNSIKPRAGREFFIELEA
jgi:SAM-dependent methyltransferase